MPSSRASLPLRTVADSKVLDVEALLGSVNPQRDAVYGWLLDECLRLDASLIVGLESWGYLLAAPTALNAKVGLAVARRRVDRLKKDAAIAKYDMNSAKGNAIGMDRTSVPPGVRVVLVDDSAISGHTLVAAAEVVQQLGGNVVGARAVVGSLNRKSEVAAAMPEKLRCYAWV